MKLRHTVLIHVVALQFCAADVGAQNSRDCRHEENWEGINVLVDQDVFWEPAFDQDYTMGLEIVAQGCFVRRAHLSSPLEGLDRLFGLRKRHEALWEDVSSTERGYTAHSFSFGDTAFTPSKAQLGETRPLLDDRPYANLMYLKARRSSARGNRALVTDLTVGILGLRVGEEVQTRIHRGRDVLPGGWPNQISDGGEFTLKYRVSPRWRLVNLLRAGERDGAGAQRTPWGIDLSASLEGNLGYYTNAGWGMSLRAGLIRSPWWGFERNAIADVRTARQHPARARGTTARPFVREAFVWASGGTTAWLYNGLLQGQFKASKAKLSFDEKSPAPLRRLTGDAQVGATVRIRPLGLGLTYGVQWLTPTFGGPKNRVHSWGSIYLSFQP